MEFEGGFDVSDAAEGVDISDADFDDDIQEKYDALMGDDKVSESENDNPSPLSSEEAGEKYDSLFEEDDENSSDAESSETDDADDAYDADETSTSEEADEKYDSFFEENENLIGAESSKIGDADDADETSTSEEAETKSEADSDTETEKDVDKLQLEAIKEGLAKLENGELTSEEKGNLCEMLMDQYYISQGYTPISDSRVTSLDGKIHQGIDGIYEKTNDDGSKEYIIAEAKYNQSTLSTTADGTKQMSEKWIDERLGKSEKADEIRRADLEGKVSTEVFHMEPDGESQSKGTFDVRSVDDNGEYDSAKEIVGEYSSSDFNFDKESDGHEG